MNDPQFTKNYFLFSSFVDNPDHYFQGYALVGGDYIFGPGGAEAYSAREGNFVGPAEDGCYVSVARSANEFIFNVDFAGNMKLFFTWAEDHWAVSNSLTILLTHLAANGVRLSPNFAQLKAAGYGSKASVLNQLTSHSTIAHNVQLVPLGCTLVIGKPGFRLQRLKDVPRASYHDALQSFCSLWTSRLVTLLNSGVAVGSDLTGGVDSRSVAAMLQIARQHTEVELPEVSVRSGVIRTDTTDLEIATKIAAHLEIPINPAVKPSKTMLKGSASYNAWYRLSLATYHPIYFPGADTNPMSASLGGGGGENHRPFYAAQDFDTFVSNTARLISPSWLAAQFASEMENSRRQMNAHERDIDPIILHYRNFRNRFHAGLAPQFSVKFAPLGSKYLEVASNALAKESASPPNINFDIIASTTPDLLEIEFDDEAKAPSETDRARLSRVEFEVAPGNSYIGEGTELAPAENDGLRPIELLQTQFQDSASSPRVRDFWGERWLAEVQRTLDDAVTNGRFAHATDGQPIGAVIASHIVLT